MSQQFEWNGVDALKVNLDDDQVIVLLDYLVKRCDDDNFSRKFIPVLDDYMRDCGMAWKVGTRRGFAGLERRVPEGVQIAAEAVMNDSDHAGEVLTGAWRAAFGVSPDPSKAYGLAIKAVETAAKPQVSPKDDVATLGKMRGVLRDQKWGLPLAQQDDEGLILREMVSALWTGQTDRHGSDGPLVTPTQEQAETAIMLAVPLVHWFSSGAASRP
ncbi:hypothetical protein LEP48_08610 [Isoptericola sp. NEAU-Y5]|uniref:Uncharacterized protein n=1 Tax=Isoptericola luteus TaxID=2879484 RepID=A0ABS7ZEE6_9MICO|nr:hypothetical protein [Isoptericola sp. NEAU-Y5]MCA5893411.1 hypothetical protein [Isoptericola sp. NEAU-Y5]